MDRTNPYFRQVGLLVSVLPHVGKQDCFALKGGTAINLFVRDLPRLSVDIELDDKLKRVGDLKPGQRRDVEAVARD